jgi:hypothetical protein
LAEGHIRPGVSACDKYPAKILEAIWDILRNSKSYPIDQVVLSQYWRFYLEGGAFDQLSEKGEPLEGPAKLEARKDGIIKFLEGIRGLLPQTEIVIILDSPHGSELDPRGMIKRNVYGQLAIESTFISKTEAVSRQGLSTGFLTAEAQRLGLKIIDPLDFVCDSTRCLTIDKEGRPLYSDHDHFTSYASRELHAYLDPTVVIGQRQNAQQNTRAGKDDKSF